MRERNLKKLSTLSGSVPVKFAMLVMRSEIQASFGIVTLTCNEKTKSSCQASLNTVTMNRKLYLL